MLSYGPVGSSILIQLCLKCNLMRHGRGHTANLNACKPITHLLTALPGCKTLPKQNKMNSSVYIGTCIQGKNHPQSEFVCECKWLYPLTLLCYPHPF